MKYRLAKKIIKKNPIIRLWADSYVRWIVAFEFHPTTDYNNLFIFYERNAHAHMMKEAHKLCIKSKNMKLYLKHSFKKHKFSLNNYYYANTQNEN